MSATLAFVTYAASIGLALILLGYFHARPWYIHTASLLFAFAIGISPPPEGWGGPAYDLTVGAAFTFLFVYGAAAPLFRQHVHHHPRLNLHAGV